MIARGLKSDYNLTNFPRTFRVFQTFKWQFSRKRYIQRRQNSPRNILYVKKGRACILCQSQVSLFIFQSCVIFMTITNLTAVITKCRVEGRYVPVIPCGNCIMNTRKLDLKDCFLQNGNKLWRNPNRILNKSNSYTNTASVCILCFFSLSIKKM